jgi:hypothetical protein
LLLIIIDGVLLCQQKRNRKAPLEIEQDVNEDGQGFLFFNASNDRRAESIAHSIGSKKIFANYVDDQRYSAGGRAVLIYPYALFDRAHGTFHEKGTKMYTDKYLRFAS